MKSEIVPRYTLWVPQLRNKCRSSECLGLSMQVNRGIVPEAAETHKPASRYKEAAIFQARGSVFSVQVTVEFMRETQ